MDSAEQEPSDTPESEVETPKQDDGKVDNLERAQDMAIVEDELRDRETERQAAEMNLHFVEGEKRRSKDLNALRNPVNPLGQFVGDRLVPTVETALAKRKLNRIKEARTELEQRYDSIDKQPDEGYESDFKDEKSLRKP